MDKTLVDRHRAVMQEFYPSLNVSQLGLFVLHLGILRASMGHELAKGTLTEYIHPEALDEDVRECYEFLMREILGVLKSRIDIDYWKKGNEGSFKAEERSVLTK